MKHFWIGAALLLVLLAAGIWMNAAIACIHEPILQALESATQAGIAGELETGAALVQQAKDRWQQHRECLAAATDHAPMDEIDGLFAQLEAYAAAGQSRDFAACCARLSKLVDAVQDSHALTWWNLL